MIWPRLCACSNGAVMRADPVLGAGMRSWLPQRQVCVGLASAMLDIRSSDEQSGASPERSRHCETPYAVQPDALPDLCHTDRQARIPEEIHMNDATSRTLFGVGVGPGDPELVTLKTCLLYTSPSPRDQRGSRMPSSA